MTREGEGGREGRVESARLGLSVLLKGASSFPSSNSLPPSRASGIWSGAAWTNENMSRGLLSPIPSNHQNRDLISGELRARRKLHGAPAALTLPDER